MTVQAQLAWTPALLGYDFGPGHPMAPVRLDLTMRLAAELGLLDAPGVLVREPGTADDAVLGRVHEDRFLDAVRAASRPGADGDLGFGLGTGDVPVFPGMHEASARIVAGSVEGALAVWSGEARHAVNVTGGLHHAMAALASGFCVYNDAAVAIQTLLDAGAARVAYVDLDAHHGDGVERIFWDDPRVLTVSVHESGRSLFPGSGFAEDTGGPSAAGTAVNVGLPAFTPDAGWLRAVDAVVPAVVRAFAPEVVVSQHGCDAHALDRLTHLQVSVDALAWGARLVHDLAHEVAGGRWLALGGGGYAVVDVVPRAWSWLIATAAHVDLDPAAGLPAGWLDYARQVRPVAAESMTDGRPVEVRPWSRGWDPGDEVDRAVRATRRAVFPLLGLDPEHD